MFAASQIWFEQVAKGTGTALLPQYAGCYWGAAIILACHSLVLNRQSYQSLWCSQPFKLVWHQLLTWLKNVIHEVEQARLKQQVEEISRDIAQWVRETREIGIYTSPANREEIEMLIRSLDRGVKLWVNEEGTILIPQ